MPPQEDEGLFDGIDVFLRFGAHGCLRVVERFQELSA
jgi:hypothetical protein